MWELSAATARYIREHADGNVRQLALQGSRDPEVDLPFALDQIVGRQTARTKLPSWAATDGIVYPPHLAMEQCSSESTARYKTRFVAEGECPSVTLLDLTGGYGVDFSFLARQIAMRIASDSAASCHTPSCAACVYVEQQERLCAIARHNFQLLGLSHATVVCGDGIDYLRQTDRRFDLIFLDPARRDSHGSRTYALSDCTPDVLAIRELLLAKADRVLLKLSPMLDWRKAVCDLGERYVREVHIVSVGNECKELLVLLAAASEQPLRLVCANDDSLFSCDGGTDEQDNGFHRTDSTYSKNPPSPSSVLPGTFLFEPNASVMKAGCFSALERVFGARQLSVNSHLFVSDRLMDGFPGRAFVVNAVSSMNKRELKAALGGLQQANITVRNFPLSVADLRRRLKIGEGGSTYIFATTLADRSHVLLLCRKANVT